MKSSKRKRIGTLEEPLKTTNESSNLNNFEIRQELDSNTNISFDAHQLKLQNQQQQMNKWPFNNTTNLLSSINNSNFHQNMMMNGI